VILQRRKQEKKMKLALAFNPFTENIEILKKAKTLIGSLKPKSLEIVFVSSPAEVQLNFAFDIDIKDRYSKYPKELAIHKLNAAGLKYSKITILEVQSASTSERVRRLAEYLKKSNFDMTLLSTHARKGMDRFFQGSFTESLILNAKSNLLVFNPHSKISTTIKKITFSHDLSKAATKNLKSIFRLANGLKSNLDVIYVSDPILSYSESTILYADTYRELNNKKITGLQKEVGKLDRKIKLFVEDGWQAISELIMKNADKNKSNLIVVNAKVGSLVAALGGSVSRQVIRTAHQPVLVFIGG
jgi:nucleotide-binding universal stress UspA family protein